MLEPELSLPAVGKVHSASNADDRADLALLMQPLHHAETAYCVEAERAMSRMLEEAAKFRSVDMQIADAVLTLRGFVANPDGSNMI